MKDKDTRCVRKWKVRMELRKEEDEETKTEVYGRGKADIQAFGVTEDNVTTLYIRLPFAIPAI